MIANKLDIEALKEVGGGWVIRHDDDSFWVLDDDTAEYLDGPFYSKAEAEARASELGQEWRGLSPALIERIRNKNKYK